MEKIILFSTLIAVQLLTSQISAEEENFKGLSSTATREFFEEQAKGPDFGRQASAPNFHDEFGRLQAQNGIIPFSSSDVTSVPSYHDDIAPSEIVRLQQANLSVLSSLKDENTQLRLQISRYQKLVDALTLKISELEKK